MKGTAMSSHPPSGYAYPPPDYPPPPPRPGLGCGTKILVFLGVVFLLLMVLCCGGVFMAVYAFQNARSEDAGTVTETTAGIAQIEVPPPLEPAASADLHLPMTRTRIIRAATYGDAKEGERDDGKTRSSVMLIGIAPWINAPTQEEAFDAAREVLRSLDVDEGDPEELTDPQRSQHFVEIRGQKVAFTITRGMGQQSKTPRIQVQGVFPGKDGPAMLILDANERRVSEEDVIKMLDSIK
jgi:hypothetical protein